MECSHCREDYSESQIQESHDIPCYLFEGIKRNIKKNKADKFGRRWLCEKCHRDYENWLRIILIGVAETSAKKYWGNE